MSIEVQKTWVKVGDTYCLFMETNSKIFTKKFRVPYYNEDVIKLNKIIKENDLIDTIKKLLDVDKVTVIDNDK